MVHLHVHSNHSLLEGTPTLRQLVARAVEHGMKALALTDTDGMYGAIPFYQAAKAAGVRPILGVKLGTCVLLARDREGYAQVCDIVTRIQLGRTPLDQLGAWPFPFGSEHLFLLSGDEQLLRALRQQGHLPLAAVTHYGGGPSRYRAEKRIALAKRLGLTPVAVCPVYFLDPDHYAIHRVLAAIRLNTTVDNLDPAQIARPEHYFRAPKIMERLYGDWPELLENTYWVAESCDLELSLGKPLFPQFPLERMLSENDAGTAAHGKSVGWGLPHQNRRGGGASPTLQKPCLPNPDETPFSALWKLTFKGLQTRYHPLTPTIIDRVRHELDIIHRLGFASYFLIVGDIVRFAKSRDIPVVGRGSAANSVVAYALGITRVDPFHYNLYFERFLNLARSDAPDIDLDICWRRRDEVIDYVYATYGADQVAMICTLNTFRARSAVREVAKAHGLTEREIRDVVRLLPRYHAGDIPALVKHIPECRGLRIDREPLKSIIAISSFIDGFPRHLSIHCAGVVIAPKRLTRFVPLQRAAKGIIITQYDMHPIEDLGLIKMDILGHRSLTVIDETVQTVRANRGIDLDIEAIPDGDPLTARMLRAGRTIGCFQIESPAMRALLQKVAACDIRTLVQCVALVRPGASGSGMKQHFIDRHHGREQTTYLHSALESVLGDTYGIMIYQEDVLKVAHAVAGMDLTEADALRSAMSKNRNPRVMAKSMKRFLEKAVQNGVEEAIAQEIWELMANFAAYAYCKAHAATYGELAYQCAYLKAHFPAEFFAAVLSNRGGFYGPPVYLEEARRQAIEVYPPDVNRSKPDYTVEYDALRVGFVEVRHLNQAAIKALLHAREDGPFQSVTDCLDRTGMGYADAEALFNAGAFDALGEPRPAQLWAIKVGCKGRSVSAHNAMSSEFLTTNSAKKRYIPSYSNKKIIDLEWKALGLLVHTHPLHYYLHHLQDSPLIPSVALSRHIGEMVTLVGWLITERRLATKDADHGIMKFLTLEDTLGTYEAVLFPEVYQTYGHLLTTLGPYLITGEVQEDRNATALIASHVEVLPGHLKAAW